MAQSLSSSRSASPRPVSGRGTHCRSLRPGGVYVVVTEKVASRFWEPVEERTEKLLTVIRRPFTATFSFDVLTRFVEPPDEVRDLEEVAFEGERVG